MDIAVIGAGRLGASVIEGLIARGHAPSVSDLNESLLEIWRPRGIKVSTSSRDAAMGASAVLLAVKPHLAAEVTKSLNLSGDQLLISCAAGVETPRLEDVTKARVARVMPNIGAAKLKSTTALFCGSRCILSDIDILRTIFEAVGEVVELQKEQDLHAATAIGGSGPAFALLALEAMEDVGVQAGLTREAARALSRGALEAAAVLTSAETHPATLRARVTSPGGTTAAGLAALESGGARAAFAAAVLSAIDRSKEL